MRYSSLHLDQPVIPLPPPPLPLKVAVCNLASIALNRFVTAQREFDFQTLFDVTKVRSRGCWLWTACDSLLSLPLSAGCDPQPQQNHRCQFLPRTRGVCVCVSTHRLLLYSIPSPLLPFLGGVLQQETPPHRNWSTGTCRCLHSPPISLRRSRGSRAQQEDL